MCGRSREGTVCRGSVGVGVVRWVWYVRSGVGVVCEEWCDWVWYERSGVTVGVVCEEW